MKKSDVEIGALYYAKVGGSVVQVRILWVSDYGTGWAAQNMATGRIVRIRTAARLRGRVGDVPPEIAAARADRAERLRLRIAYRELDAAARAAEDAAIGALRWRSEGFGCLAVERLCARALGGEEPLIGFTDDGTAMAAAFPNQETARAECLRLAALAAPAHTQDGDCA